MQKAAPGAWRERGEEETSFIAFVQLRRRTFSAILRALVQELR